MNGSFHRPFMYPFYPPSTSCTKEVYNEDHEQQRATRGGRPSAAF